MTEEEQYNAIVNDIKMMGDVQLAFEEQWHLADQVATKIARHIVRTKQTESFDLSQIYVLSFAASRLKGDLKLSLERQLSCMQGIQDVNFEYGPAISGAEWVFPKVKAMGSWAYHMGGAGVHCIKNLFVEDTE